MPFFGNNSNFIATTPTTGDAPLSVSFEPDLARGFVPVNDVWDYGDGGTATATDSGSSYIISHTYNFPGTYSVTLTGTHPLGLPNPSVFTETDYITVTGTAPPRFSASTPTTGALPLSVSFQPTAGRGFFPISDSWDFGDGSPAVIMTDTGSGYTISHNYITAGVYSVTITSTNTGGPTNPIIYTRTNYITITGSVEYGGGSFTNVRLRGLRVGKPI